MRALIVEDQGMFRDLLAKVLVDYFRFERVVAVATGREADAALRAEQLDLVILDMDLPDKDGFAIAADIAKLDSPPYVLGMSAYCDEFMVHRVMDSSINGFIDKSEQTIETLEDALAAVRAGRFFVTDTVRRMQLALRDDPRAFPKILTERECQVITLVASGKANDEVADQLGIGMSTVLWHRKRIMRKLGLHSERDLILFAARKGFTRRSGGLGAYSL